jgi:hypothetical protein
MLKARLDLIIPQIRKEEIVLDYSMETIFLTETAQMPEILSPNNKKMA